jgi:twitching motility protein PilT
MPATDNINLNRLLTTVARQGASDLHLTLGAPPVLRKDGALFPLENEEIVTGGFLDRMMESFVSEEDRHNLEGKQEMLIVRAFNKILRFRVHVYRQKGNYTITFHYIPLVNKKLTELGLSPFLEKVICDKTGLFIITGAYDSGKSTTLAAIINTLNEFEKPRYITTLERPIEYIYANNKCLIEQREVGKDVASYTQGLRAIIDNDIDMVVLDRIEGSGVMKKVLEVLEAGKTVIIILDASYTSHAIQYIFDLLQTQETIWARKVLAAHLQCILLQKLVHKIGGGRAMAFELLINAGMVPSIIASGNLDRLEGVFRGARESDTISLDETLARLVKTGEVKLDEALLESGDRNYLKSLLR